jgi:DUF177 domain-containing protein
VTERGSIELAGLSLSPGQARSLEPDLRLEPIRLGGQDYLPDQPVAPRLDVSRTAGGGYALRLRYRTALSGPCVRCLEEAGLETEVDAREVDQPIAGDEELRSPYVDHGRLAAERWANDALVLSLPSQPLCREDCKGLCSVCGESLNDADPAEHRHQSTGDPRMAKLRDLRLE